MKIENIQRISNLLFIYVLCALVSTAYIFQYVIHEHFCPPCLLQRLSMISICYCLLVNLRYGISAKYYGLAILCIIEGAFISLWQISYHACPQFPSTSPPLLGLRLYSWALIIFAACLFSIAVLLMLLAATKQKIEPKWGKGEKIAFTYLSFLLISHIIFIPIQCGLSTCAH